MQIDVVASVLKSIRQNLGLPPYAYIPMRYVPEELFIDTSCFSPEGWPDLTASDLADWPSSTKDLDDETSDESDVGLVLAFCGSVPPQAEQLFLLRHRTSGHWRESLRLACVPLELSIAGALLGSTIARRWHGTGVSTRFAALETIEEYRNSLRAYRLDCNECFQYFAEGAYPIDLDDESLVRLSTMSDFHELPFPVESLEGACLLLLAPNSS